MKSSRRITALVAAAFAAVLATLAGTASAGSSATTLVIWTDDGRKPAVERIANAWAATRGVEIKIVTKGFGDIRDDLRKAPAETAADVIVGAHDWIGQLAADGVVVPINPRRTALSQFPDYALDAFSYGTAVKKLYAAPVTLENIGLVVNTRLAKVPTSFADFEKQALAFKNKKKGNIACACPQGAAGDAYHMYPFFSGLGGYVFGKNKAGNLDASDIGVANPRFLKNASTIDRWNKTGFINSKIDYATARDSFLKRKAAFWLTGPWEADNLRKSGLKIKIVPVPPLKYRSVPFLGVQGFMVSKFAATHGVESLAKDFVGSYLMTASSQRIMNSVKGTYPANTVAAKSVKDPLLAAWGKAGVGAVPMPNIPQMASVWTELGGAWVKSTKGAGATKAATAFRVASRNIANKIG